MAIGTGDILVFGGARHQEVVSFLMTGTAEFGWCVIGINNLQRHMGFVAGQAVTLHHVIGMGGVAVRAVRQLAMGGMTGGAELFGMFAWILL